MKQEKKTKTVERKGANVVTGACTDRDCPIHGHLKAHGRSFQGFVRKKFPRRVVIEFERMIYVQKYERYKRSKTKLHARVPHCMEEQIKIGDLIEIKECRPLSKIIHFVVIKVVKSAEDENKKEQGEEK